MIGKIWNLTYSIDHTVEEDPYDAKLIPPLEDNEDWLWHLDQRNHCLRKSLYFSTIFDNLESIDFVYNDQSWCIASDSMIRALGLDQIYTIHNSIMIDSKIRSDDDPRISRDFGYLDCIQHTLERPHLNREDYKVISISPLEHAMNLQESEYKMFSSGDGILSIKKLILNNREGGYPPIFRIAELPTRLYITQEAREKLKQAGITGPAYYPVDGSKRIEEIDNPIVFPDIEA